MFGQNNIRKHVIAAVDQMIDGVQKAYDAEVEQIERNAEQAKMDAREKAVSSIISKFQ